MALKRGTARRYAEAAFEIAQRDGTMEAWLAAMLEWERRLVDPGIVGVLGSPAVSVASRLDLLDRLLGDALGGAPRNLVALLIRRGRFDRLPDVIREFRRLHARHEGIVAATVTSASPLDDADRQALEARLASMTSQRVEMDLLVDPELLGGITVRLGDRLIDGSVRGRLERLRAAFATSAT